MMNDFIEGGFTKYLVDLNRVNNFNIINKGEFLVVEADVFIDGSWVAITGQGQGTVKAFIDGFIQVTNLGYDFYDTHESMVVVDGVKKVCVYVIVTDNNGGYQYASYVGDNAVVGLFECYVFCVNKFVDEKKVQELLSS
jgi:hypothetical protein